VNRALLALALVVAFVLGIGFAFRRPIAIFAMDRLVQRNMASSLVDELADGLHVGLCGAGSPLPDPERSGPCVVVIAGKQVYVVDSGAGSPENLARMRVPQGSIEAVLLTHFHSDHIDGLGELMMQRWVNGAHTEPLPVYGPHGVAQVVDGFNRAYAQDAAYRVAHHGDATVPASGAGGAARPFALPTDGRDTPVLERAGLVVTAFRVDHEPIDPAIGYRFDYGGRSVVVSGDTTKSANLQRVAQDVDLLVHEALSAELVGNITRAARVQGRANLAKITTDSLSYHATPVEAAEIARDAGAGHLLYYHVVPPLPLYPLREAFLDGVDEVYAGPVTLGVDGTFVSLPSGSEAIDVRELL
jgi:ribonuclease Z